MLKPAAIHKILIFFSSNPEIVLTREELAKKFGASTTTVAENCHKLENRGLLLWSPLVKQANGSRQYGYAAGPELLHELGYETKQLC